MPALVKLGWGMVIGGSAIAVLKAFGDFLGY